jgi:prepilin-type N-terminal cleavage/methylation domain-containing protein
MRIAKGFTVIELMVTLVVLGAGVGALTYLQTRMVNATVFTSAQYDALNLANNKIADWQAMAYDSIPVETAQTDSSTINNVTYSRTWNISQFTDPTYKVIDVAVSWSDASGTTHSVKLATAVAKTSQAAANV